MPNPKENITNKLSNFLLPIFGGLLGAIGGSGNKPARRFGIPFMLSGLAYQKFENPIVFSIMIMCGILSIGYGIPSYIYVLGQSPILVDEGSILGRFYYKLFKQNHKLTDIATRGTIGKLIALSMISIPIIKHNWIIYIICSLGIILTNALLSWRNFGTFVFNNKELNKVEFIIWGLITLFCIIIIGV